MQSYDHRLHPTIVLVILNYTNEIRVLHKQATVWNISKQLLTGFTTFKGMKAFLELLKQYMLKPSETLKHH